MNRINSIIVVAQFLCTLFVALAFGLVINYSSVISPGGSLLSVLERFPVLRIPMSTLGGLSILLVLLALGLYASAKPKN